MRHSLLLLVLLSPAACTGTTTPAGPSDGSPPPVEAHEGGLLDRATNADAESNSLVAPFVGTWTVSQGSSTVTCPGAPIFPDAGLSTSDVGGMTQLTPGPTPGTLVGSQIGGAGCTFTYAVVGNVATLSGSQTCVPGGPMILGCLDDAGVPGYDGGGDGYRDDGGPTTWTLLAETLTLAADGTLVDIYNEDLDRWLSYCDDSVVIQFNCAATAAGDMWTKQ
jgi:hypothetical protein